MDKVDNQNSIDFWLPENNMATIIMDIKTGIDLSVIGISYCEAYPQNKRCESLKIGGGGHIVIIDWDENRQANAMISLQDATGVSFTLHKVNSETRDTFRKILSTFKNKLIE